MPEDDLTKLMVAFAEVKTKVEALTQADKRTRENIKGIYGKLDKLMYFIVALLAGIIGDIVSHNLN